MSFRQSLANRWALQISCIVYTSHNPKQGFTEIIVYHDNFLIIGATHDQCQLAYDMLSQLLQDLGFSISEHKLVPPTQCLTFLGVQLDTIACMLTLPADKLAELHKLVLGFQNKHG